MQKFNFVLKSVHKNSLSFTFRICVSKFYLNKKAGGRRIREQRQTKTETKKLQYFVYGLGTMPKLRKLIRLNKN